MITQAQWYELEAYVLKRLEKEERFSETVFSLSAKIGFTSPFWEQMCEFDRTETHRYHSKEHYYSNEEPIEFEFWSVKESEA